MQASKQTQVLALEIYLDVREADSLEDAAVASTLVAHASSDAKAVQRILARSAQKPRQFTESSLCAALCGWHIGSNYYVHRVSLEAWPLARLDIHLATTSLAKKREQTKLQLLAATKLLQIDSKNKEAISRLRRSARKLDILSPARQVYSLEQLKHELLAKIAWSWILMPDGRAQFCDNIRLHPLLEAKIGDPCAAPDVSSSDEKMSDEIAMQLLKAVFVEQVTSPHAQTIRISRATPNEFGRSVSDAGLKE
jgi:hypothetical protein